MPSVIKDPDRLRSNLKEKTVYVLVYCHADVAWTHSRLWHVNRYVLALDEALDRIESDPQFRYFIDSWTEMLHPYLQERPDSHDRVAEAVRSGRLALCAGHWGNLRMTQVGNETTIRNIVLGRRAVEELVPGFQPRVYSNLDVAIGHSQVPQIMRLAGIEGYLAWRPSAGLDAQDVPRSFLWKGLSGDAVTVCRMCYGTGNTVPEQGWDADWRKSLDCLGPDIEVAAAQPGVSTLGLFIGMDDTRPLLQWGSDEPCRTAELIEAWNAHGMGVMGYGTPEELFAHLAGDQLPVVSGTLDEAEVCYNLNWLGHRSLAWWREKADRALVEAEMLDAISALRGGLSRRHSLDRAWKQLLEGCPHAQQMLFAEDEHERHRMLSDAVATADSVREDALARLLPLSLPLDATHVAFINPAASGGLQVVRALIPNHDRTHAGFALLDESGHEIPVQFTEKVFMHDEFEVEAALDLPPCGIRACRIEWREGPVVTDAPQQLPLNARVTHGGLALRFERGHLAGIDDDAARLSWKAAGSCSLLAPTVQTYTGGTWLPDSLSPHPLPLQVTGLELADSGPVRTRVTRTMKVRSNVFRQHLDIYGLLGEVRVTTDMLLREEGVYPGLALPTPPEAELAVDIPFGIEPRRPAEIPCGRLSDVGHENLERRIPGYFWGRSWVSATTADACVALIAEDGDRFFWQHPSGEWLTHFFLRVPRQPKETWEARSTLDRGVGRHVFHHVLTLRPPTTRGAAIARRAQQLHMPARWVALRPNGEELTESWIALEPEAVQFSALYREGQATVLRIYNDSDAPVQACITTADPCLTAAHVDFHIQSLDRDDVRVSGNTLALPLAPWQIATLVLHF